MKNGHFPIGFWNWLNISDEGPAEVARWKRCGITWNLSPLFSYKENTKEQMLELLDECERQNITLTIHITELDYTLLMKDRQSFIDLFERAYADFGEHPATEGFYIGDEPAGKAQFEACIEAHNIMLAKNPKQTPFVNFMVYGDEVAKETGMSFSEWAKDFIKRSGCKMLCHDYYAQLVAWPDVYEAPLDGYFRMLREYAELSIETGMDYWSILLCTAHMLYKAPTEDEIRWQLYTSVASGCRGIMWFLFYEILGNSNYRGSPIDCFGEETETYQYIRRVQQVFHAMYGDLMLKLRLKKTWHFGESYGGYPIYQEGDHPLILKMISWPELPGILSIFEDDEGKEYFCIVNNSKTMPAYFGFELKKETKKILQVYNNGKVLKDFSKEHFDANYVVAEDRIHANLTLAPGQMQMFIIE